jgi:hypothetical protein
LQGCLPTHYCARAGQARPAITLGIAARIGTAGSQRLAIPCLLVQAAPDEPGGRALPQRLLQHPQARLAADAARGTDRGFPLAQLHAAQIERSVRRGPTNFTARRASLPPYRGQGRRPTTGALVRPWPRTYQGRTLAAPPPDRRETWQGGTREQPCMIPAQCWDNLVPPAAPPGAPTFPRVVIHDPRFSHPLVLHTLLPLRGAQAQAL